MPLFENITYHLSKSLAEDTRLQISRILDSNGATAVSNIDLATHILSDTTEFEGCDSLNLRTSVACVTPYWVERSMELGHLQDPKYFSADKDMFFSGVVATSADLPTGDKEVIASGILAQGGAWREGLTRDVTHLLVTNTRSEKYLTAMHFRESAHITVVLPQWFDQCWSTQMRLPSEVFQFPDPPYLHGDHDIAAYKAQMLLKKPAAGSHHLESGFDKQVMYGTMQIVDTSSPPPLRNRNIWEGRSIMLSPSLELDAQRRESVESRIRRSGGVVVIAQEEVESVVVEGVDIFITRFRTGAAYGKALAAGKTVGTLAWLFYVERTGIMSRPRDQLLHYPVRSTPIQGFSDHEITVTNYQGDAREYLKKLIEVMGAKFTPTMSGRNTIVIAAYKCGKKTAKAEEWSVPVVTHKWLEDCFVEWRNLTPAQKKYLDYAAGVNYGTILGDRGVGRVGLEEDPELLLPEITKEPALKQDHPNDEKPVEVEQPEGKTGNGEGVTGTATSMREALEVDEVEDVLHVNGDPLNGDPQDNRGDDRRAPPLPPTKFGPPRGIKKTPTKAVEATEHASATPKSRNSVSDTPAKATGAAGGSLIKSSPSPPEGGPDSKLPAATGAAWRSLIKSPGSPESGSDSKLPAATGAAWRSLIKSPGSPESGSDSKLPAAAAPVKGMAAMKVGPPVKSTPKSKPISSTKATAQRDSDNEVVVVEPLAKDAKTGPPQRDEELSTSGTTHPTTPKPKPKPRTRLASGSDQESTDDMRDKKRVKGKSPVKQVDTDDQSDRDPFTPGSKPKSKSKPTVYKSRTRITARPYVGSEEEDREPSGADESFLRTTKIKPSPTKANRGKATTSRAKGKTVAFTSESGSDDDEIMVLPLKKGARTTGAVTKRTRKAAVPQPSPHRFVSVDLPDARTLLQSTRPRSSFDSVTQPGSASRRIVKSPKPAYEASPSSPTRGRPSAKKFGTSSRSSTPPPRRSSPRRPPSGSTLNARKMNTASTSATLPPPPIQRTPSRRTAAAAATQKLRDEVMPDVVNYENEQRKRGAKGRVGVGRRRKGSQSSVNDDNDQEGEEEEEESDVDVRARKKRKIANDDGDDDSRDDRGATVGRSGADDSDAPARRFVTNAKSSKRPADDDDGKRSADKRNGQDGSRKRVRRERSVSAHSSENERKRRRSVCDPRKIRVLTTKVVITEQIDKAMTRLGVKFIQKPHGCTHLVTNGLSRTEKFLCALPNAPFVLSLDWLTACAESGRIVAEDDYTLQDPDMEHKHKFKLVEALERARELKRNKRKLLQGHFFYVTPGVPSDFNTLKKVLQALGAECRETVPTIRNVSETRHVISSLKDESLWRPLVKHGVTIYSHELILGAAFTQVVDWDGEDKILAKDD